MLLILFVISWFAVGIWSVYKLLINDMKHARYNENYFDGGKIALCLSMIFLGYISFAVYIGLVFEEKTHFVGLYRKLYYIANPDKKDTDKKE